MTVPTAIRPAPYSDPVEALPPACRAKGPAGGRGMLQRLLDRLIVAGSLVPDRAVLDVRLFPWTQGLRENWRAICVEAAGMTRRNARPQGNAEWRPFALWADGDRINVNADRCPLTSALVERVPGLCSAAFSIHAPGTHLPAHCGGTKALITCQLGLVVPGDGDVRMRVGDRVVRWAEGETLVFDDTCCHEAWNEAGGTQLVLHLQFERPLRGPARWLSALCLRIARRAGTTQTMGSETKAFRGCA